MGKMGDHEMQLMSDIDMRSNPLLESNSASGKSATPAQPRKNEDPYAKDFGDGFFSQIVHKLYLKYAPEKGVGTKGMIANRFAVCMLAVALLWLSSFQICYAIVAIAVSSPSADYVYDQCEAAYDEIQDQKDQYSDCTDRQLHSCNVTFTAAVDDEVYKIDTASATNRGVVQAQLDLETACNDAYVQALDVTESLQTMGQEVAYVNDTAVCTASELEEVKAMTGDIAEYRNYAYSLNKNFAANSVETASRLSKYAEERVEYDTTYVGEKTEDLTAVPLEVASISAGYQVQLDDSLVALNLSDMVTCVSLQPGCTRSPNAYALYSDAVTSLEVQYTDALSTYDENVLLLDDYIAQVEDLKDATTDLVNYLDSITDFLNTLSGGFNWGLVPSLDEINIYPISLYSLSAPVEVMSASEMYASVEPYVQEYEAEFDAAVADTMQVGENWESDVYDATADLPDTFDDYNPPQENTTKIVEDMEKDADEYLVQSSVALNNFAALDSADKLEYNPNAYNASTVFAGLSNYTSSGYFDYKGLSGDVDVEWIYVSFNGAFALVVLFDYLFRAFHTYHTIARFWSKGACEIPVVDMTIDAREGRTIQLNSSRSTYQVILGIMFHPMVPTVLATLFGVLFITALAVVYGPWFNDYKRSCVEKDGTGTVLTDNLYAIAYNYASEDGNEARFEGLEAYNVNRESVCAQYAERSASDQYELERDLDYSKQSYDEQARRVSIMNDCLDTDSMDTTIETVLPEGTPSMSSLVTTEECYQVEALALSDGTFECDNIPQCGYTCQGPSEEIIALYTFNCGCNIEYYLHSGLIRGLMSLMMYILLNISRVVLIKGICRYNWRDLTVGYFTFTGTCTRLGNIESVEGLESELAETLRKVERYGLVMIFLSIILHVPWITILSLVSPNIEYANK
eukprot:Rmarinus@m.9042